MDHPIGAERAQAAGRDQDGAATRRLALSTLATIIAVTAVLHFGREIFLPLAIAILITFALSPVVSLLRTRGLPQLASVLGVVTVAFAVIALFMMIVAGQLGQLAQDLPKFQANIVTKLDNLAEVGEGNAVLGRLGRMMAAINTEIGAAVPGEAAAPVEPDPMKVEVVERLSPVEMLQELVVPLVRPVATAGLVVVVVIFMLLAREDLRDRFIRLVGSNDIHRTTQVLEEAGGRVGTYLLIQLLVNLIYAIPIGVGLWLIGVPNALLWGVLTLVLRFVPYIGSILAAAFPMFLAFAVSPDWTAVVWTVVLFLAVELVTSNVVEPWLYGSRTGVSPLAIIVSAIFWTWIWGPMGLVLSTPLTVCLVVLGRHIPQFEVFDILFGDEPVLAPHSRLYQRLLAGDAVESTFRAEEALEEAYLSDYYRDVGLPALSLAQFDRDRGVLTPDQEGRLAETALRMVQDLDPVVAEELIEARQAVPDAEAEPAAGILTNETLDGVGRQVLSIGGRSRFDDVAAAMLGQIMAAEGAQVAQLTHADLAPSRFAAVQAAEAGCVVLNFLDPNPSRASLLHVRRIKRAFPDRRVGVVLWQMPEGLPGQEAGPAWGVSADKLREADEIGADFVVTSVEAALAEAFSDKAPKPLAATPRKARRAIGRARPPLAG